MDKNLENALTLILEISKKQQNVNADQKEFKKEELDKLKDEGLIKIKDVSTMSSWGYLVTLTHDGLIYFENEEEKLKGRNRKIIWEIIKFALPTLIALVSLIVSLTK